MASFAARVNQTDARTSAPVAGASRSNREANMISPTAAARIFRPGRRLLAGLAGALAAVTVTFFAPVAQADTRCETAAYSARGVEIRGTRTAAVRPSERRACSAALSNCEARLDRVRWESGRRRPHARCEVIRLSYFSRPTHRPRYRDDYSRPWPRYERPERDWRRSAPRCNYRACERRYRSFRASDCSFQPYRGPRKRCPL